MVTIEMLCKGKTDTELLNALVAALTDNDEDLIAKLRDSNIKGYGARNTANVEVIAAIVKAVSSRNVVVEG
jgi:hypothetical protein